METLPKDLEDIILDYKSQIEHYEKYERVLYQIENMNYFTNPLDNCCSFEIVNGSVVKTYHIKFCKVCGKYYRTKIVHYTRDVRHSFRYSHYNTFMNYIGDETDVITSDYVVNYGGDNLYWTNVYRNRTFNKNISCDCLRRIFNGGLDLALMY